MKVYRIKSTTDAYDVVDLDVVTLMEKLLPITDYDEDSLLELLRRAPLNNTRLKEMWPEEMECLYFRESKAHDYDINVLGSYLVLKMNAYNVLHKYLDDFGEFLPLNVEGNKMMMFNSLTFGQENKALCENSDELGFEDDLKTLYFQEDDIASKVTFKSKLRHAAENFCTDTLKDLVEKNEFTGVLFDTELIHHYELTHVENVASWE